MVGGLRNCFSGVLFVSIGGGLRNCFSGVLFVSIGGGLRNCFPGVLFVSIGGWGLKELFPWGSVCEHWWQGLTQDTEGKTR